MSLDEWRDACGVVHKLKDMSESYIKNVMRFIGKDDDFWYACEAELNRRLDYDRH